MKSFFVRVWNALRGAVSPNEWQLIGFVLALKLAFLYLGYIAHETYQDKPVENVPLGYLNEWSRWDAENYLHIAEHGYVTETDRRFSIVFFPGYPLFTHVGMRAGLPPVASAYLVTTIASCFVAVLLYRLARLDANANAARRTVWLLFAFPTAYFLHAIGTESLFLAWTLAAFLAARRGRWSLCGVCGFFAVITRMNGLLVIVCLLAEAFTEWRRTKRLNPDWVFLALPPLGTLLYLRLNYAVWHNPFQFMVFQRDHWNHHLTFPWVGISNALVFSTYASSGSAQMTGTQEFLFAVFGLLFSGVVAAKCRLSYGVWCFGNWFLITSMDFLTSTPRYILLFFPFFLLLGQFTRRAGWFAVIFASSLLMCGMFAVMYSQGRWAW